jgi:hypothetical protein
VVVVVVDMPKQEEAAGLVADLDMMQIQAVVLVILHQLALAKVIMAVLLELETKVVGVEALARQVMQAMLRLIQGKAVMVQRQQ